MWWFNAVIPWYFFFSLNNNRYSVCLLFSFLFRSYRDYYMRILAFLIFFSSSSSFLKQHYGGQSRESKKITMMVKIMHGFRNFSTRYLSRTMCFIRAREPSNLRFLIRIYFLSSRGWKAESLRPAFEMSWWLWGCFLSLFVCMCVKECWFLLEKEWITLHHLLLFVSARCSHSLS